MQQFNALLIEDEAPVLKMLNYFISSFVPEITIVGEATNVEQAIVLYNKTKPDILFLDIQLHNKNAFDFLDAIDFSEVEVVFITAYENYAIKAFKYQAVDYLLKPLDIEDLKLASHKAMQRVTERKHFETKKEETKSKQNNTLQYLDIISIGRVDTIKVDDIVFCKSDGSYTTFYMVNEDEHVSSKNLGEFEKLLNNTTFFRIHHSYIINSNHILTIIKKAGYTCEMINNISLPIAKRREESLRTFLKLRRNS